MVFTLAWLVVVGCTLNGIYGQIGTETENFFITGDINVSRIMQV